jgi:CRISPR-associated protein Csx10
MIAIRYTLKLLEPLLATALQSDPNSAVSYPYIPGSLIRGMLIGKYLTDTEEKYFAVKGESRRRFLDGRTRYLNGYVLDPAGNRTLPTPLSWYHEKGAKPEDRYGIFDKSYPEFNDGDFLEAEPPIDQPKPQEPQFCVIDEGNVTFFNPDRQVNIHTRREDRRAGRATDDDLGAVFRYDALAAGQFFGGVILCDDPADAKTLVKNLTVDTEFVVGGSRSGGYGRVRVTDVESISNWRETEASSDDIPAGEMFTVTLLSDMIARDRNGQFADTLSLQILTKALGLPDGVLLGGKTYRQIELVGGFNRKWGLPLPQAMAICAGSVFTFHTTVDIPAAALEALQWRGLGDRRVEGFGRVAINWIGEDELYTAQPDDREPTLEKPPMDTESQTLARRMTERIFRRNADHALVEKASRITIHPSPKRSQLGGLRAELRQAMQNGTVQPVINYLNAMKPTADKQFKNARIGSETLKDWLLVQLQNPNNIWLQLGNPDKNPLHLEGVEPSSQLATEYTLRFVDAVLAQASKKERDND